MSFGFSISDVISLIKITGRAYEGWRDAPSDYVQVTATLKSLRITLDRVQQHFHQDRDGGGLAADEHFERIAAIRADLAEVVVSCNGTVTKLHAIARKCKSMSGQQWSTIDRIRMATKDVNGLLSQLTPQMSILSNFLLAVEMDSLGRSMDSLPARLAAELPSVLKDAIPVALGHVVDAASNDQRSARDSILTTYGPDDDKRAWKELRGQLRKAGVSDVDVQKHSVKLMKFMQSIINEEEEQQASKEEEHPASKEAADRKHGNNRFMEEPMLRYSTPPDYSSTNSSEEEEEEEDFRRTRRRYGRSDQGSLRREYLASQDKPMRDSHRMRSEQHSPHPPYFEEDHQQPPSYPYGMSSPTSTYDPRASYAHAPSMPDAYQPYDSEFPQHPTYPYPNVQSQPYADQPHEASTEMPQKDENPDEQRKMPCLLTYEPLRPTLRQPLTIHFVLPHDWFVLVDRITCEVRFRKTVRHGWRDNTSSKTATKAFKHMHWKHETDKNIARHSLQQEHSCFRISGSPSLDMDFSIDWPCQVLEWTVELDEANPGFLDEIRAWNK